MPSLAKSQSARANGAKSRGPATEAGKQRSSQNAIRHGLTAQTLVLPCEDPADYQRLLDSYLDYFHPSSPVELDLVQEMELRARLAGGAQSISDTLAGPDAGPGAIVNQRLAEFAMVRCATPETRRTQRGAGLRSADHGKFEMQRFQRRRDTGKEQRLHRAVDTTRSILMPWCCISFASVTFPSSMSSTNGM